MPDHGDMSPEDTYEEDGIEVGDPADPQGRNEFMEGAQLVGSLMAASAKDLAWTTNQIEEMDKAEIKRLRALVLEMAGVFESATVVDRQTEALWRGLDHRIMMVEDAVYRERSGS